jgi:hypothetical protein
MPPGRKPRRFTKAEIKLFGTAGDVVIGRKLGCSGQVIMEKRHELGIPAFRPRQEWTKQQLSLVGKLRDRDFAKRFGRSVTGVRSYRAIHEIPSASKKAWSAKEITKLGTMSDPAVAKLLGRPRGAVKSKRKSLGIPPFKPKKIVSWSRSEIAVLRSFGDDLQVARMTGKLLDDVTEKRADLGL